MKKVKTKKKRKSKADTNVNAVVLLIVSAIVIGAFVSIFALRSNGRQPQQVYDFGKEIAVGIDVSEHNGDVDWSKVSESQDFAFIRVGYRTYGEGGIFEDKRGRENLKNAEKSGMPFGVYFYTQATNKREAEEEADFVYDIIKRYEITLPVIIDFEYATDRDGNAVGKLYQANNGPDDNAEIINAFADRLKSKGYICGVYASSSVLAHRINMKKLNSDLLIWAADYNDRVTYNVDYTIWQYSETGSCDGVSSKYVDLNYWYSN